MSFSFDSLKLLYFLEWEYPSEYYMLGRSKYVLQRVSLSLPNESSLYFRKIIELVRSTANKMGRSGKSWRKEQGGLVVVVKKKEEGVRNKSLIQVFIMVQSLYEERGDRKMKRRAV